MTDSINININVSFPDLNDEKTELETWATLARYAQDILKNKISISDAETASGQPAKTIIQMVEKILDSNGGKSPYSIDLSKK